MSPEKRVRCKLCRWKACVKAGMSFECIKMGRIPKKEKQQKLNYSEHIQTSLEYNWIDKFPCGDLLLFSFLKEKCFGLYFEESQFYSRDNNSNALDSNQLSFNLVLQEFLNMISNFTKWLVKYIKKLPAFDQVSSEDIVKILNKRLFVVLGLVSAKLFINEELYLMLNNQIQFSRYWCQKVYGKVLSDKIFYYHSKLNDLELNETEIAVLIPYVLSFDGYFFKL